VTTGGAAGFNPPVVVVVVVVAVATRAGVEPLTTTSFRSREATPFATSAQTIAATISVAASRTYLPQFIVD
jgi:hypothetical protein